MQWSSLKQREDHFEAEQNVVDGAVKLVGWLVGWWCLTALSAQTGYIVP